MNPCSQLGLKAVLALALLTLGWAGQPVQAQGPQPQTPTQDVTPSQDQQQVKLLLTVAKQIETINAQGQPQTDWRELSGDTVQVVPGDVLRYTLAAINQSDRPALNLAITQPIPPQTVYVLESATGEETAGIAVAFSIDQGSSFVPNPTINVTQEDGTVVTKPAPAELYTHVRWTFTRPIAAQTTENVSYQVNVK